jgi:hypothetical protein
MARWLLKGKRKSAVLQAPEFERSAHPAQSLNLTE